MSDLLIKNAKIITFSERKDIKKYYPNGKILIEKNKIKKVGRNSEINERAEREIDAQGKLILPGLLNGHNHYEQSFMRPITQVYTGKTYEWILNLKIPITREMKKEDYYLSNLITCIELIKSGVTCSVNFICQQDPAKLEKFGIEESVRAVKDSGVRSVIPIGVADKFEPEDYLVSPEKGKKIIEDSIKRWNHAFDDRVRIWPGPTGIFAITGELSNIAKELADKYGTGIHTHLASSERGEVEKAKELDLLRENFVGAHCVWLDEKDIQAMANSGMKVVHNPWYKLGYALDSSVERFGDGIAPITDMKKFGITVGLGQDGCMGATQDMFKEMRVLAYTQHYRYRDKTLFPPSKLLEMVTIDCARTMLWEDEIGSIEEGKKADIVIFKAPNHKYFPYHYGINLAEKVFKNGKLVAERGRRIK